MDFSELNLNEQILTALGEEGYSEPTPIQAEAIPIVLEGRDLLGCAQTGTGKTAAFAIPILQRLAERPAGAEKRKISALVITPTRELALQIHESFTAYGISSCAVRLYSAECRRSRRRTRSPRVSISSSPRPVVFGISWGRSLSIYPR